MEPIFTLPWSEFVVAQQIQKHLPKKDGYSLLIPLSRQEKGIDLVILRRKGSGCSQAYTIQVKASRTYFPEPPKRESTKKYDFNTWFNRFKVPSRADFVVLFGMYMTRRNKVMRVKDSKKWYKYCSLIFTREEMCQFLKKCRTIREGKPDNKFGFGFNEKLTEVIWTRGDKSKLRKPYTSHLLTKARLNKLIGQITPVPPSAV